MKVIKSICLTIFTLLALLYVFIVISPRIFSGFYPFGIKAAIVLTGSMSPAIEINDFVIMREPGEIKVGDIVAYKDNSMNMEVLHRVVSIDNDEVLTKGDANNTKDKPIKRDQITGVYVGTIKYLGTVILFVTKPIVFSIIITTVLIMIIITRKKHPKDSRKEKKDDKEKK